ncbi:cell wall mannoprotein 1 family protein [Aspergillus candidus]|uniref:Hydrophobic surface binding protein A-domain-containing protein n=1 Tax=Aspergillus candidus TaxID=41067 RepID=A0A2I2F856_ASPCN|nr:hypothetical protein BDW47DRAFT_108102 [Aspergillus candidus]PLB36810.1 hypothetical protein BDW47DRAFT_108102 [Aspergillus candidus]
MRVLGLITLFLITVYAGTYTVDHGFSDVQTLTDHVRDVNSKLDRFNGGLLQGLDLVNTIHKAHNHASTTRRSIKALGNFTADDSDRGFPHVQDLIQMMAVTFETSQAKREVTHKGAFSYIAQGMALSMYQEKNRLEEVLRSKAPDEYYQKCASDLEKLDNAWQEYFQDLGD